MVALSPRFTFLATLCVLAAFSSVPISDAAVLRLRASDAGLTEMMSSNRQTGAAAWFPSRSSHAVGDPPVLPLPKGSGKDFGDSGDGPSGSRSEDDRKTRAGRGPQEDKDASTGDNDEHNPYEVNGAVSKKGENTKVKDRRWNPYNPIKKLSGSWFGDNHDYHARASYRHHHHHHHNHHNRFRRGPRSRRRETEHDRDLSASAISEDDGRVVNPRSHRYYHGPHEKIIVSGDHDHVHIGSSPHHHHHHTGYEKVIISGDHEHVRVGRSPHHHHHHHHHNEYEKVVISGDHDHVRVERSPHPRHYHHHHYNGHEKVVVSGDHDHVRFDRSPDSHRLFEDAKAITSNHDDHVHLQRSVLIAGEQGQSYVVPRVVRRSAAQELLAVPPLGKRASGSDGVPGHIDITSPVDDSPTGKRIASLVLTSPNSTTPTNSSNPFILNASNMDATQMYLVASASNSSNSTLTPDETAVTFRILMFDVASASIVPYCATFDPDPPSPAPLTAEECTDDPVGDHQSQSFAFNRATGVVRPMWRSAQDDGRDSESSGCIGDVNGTAPQNASQSSVTDVDGSHPVPTPSTDRASTVAVLTADPSQSMASSDSSEDQMSSAQNVALVFVASNPEVLATPAEGSATMSAVLGTTTGTEAGKNTVSTAAGSSTAAMASSTPGSLTTASPMQVAVSSSGSISAAAVSFTGSSTSVSASGVVSSAAPASVTSSTALASGTSSAPSTVLEVQVVPVTASNAVSTTSASATPVVTPVNTQPYEWMFKPDSQ
ncbi:hypothetical protein BC826DRAFT_446560 [Russula brevipes]|nr:hypothetical protein BC826DRAFT_446560 [Russula brevipes]